MPEHAEADVLPPPLPRAGRTLAVTMLAWTLLVVAVVTLAPFRFRVPDGIHLEWHSSAYELAVNCVLLVVPGLLFRAATGPNRDSFCVGPFVFGLLVSGVLELAQGLVPGRCTSPVDVAANAAGCWFGAMCHDSLRRQLRPRLAGKLLFELPLMGLVYLMVPLLWFCGEAAANDPLRLALTVPLGVMGGGILAAVWHHRLRPAGLLSPAKIAALAAVWYVAAAAPGLRHNADLLAAGTAAVAAATRLLATSRWFLRAEGHRFEMPTLRRVGWLYVAYLVVLAAWPWRGEIGPWRGGWKLDDVAESPGLLQLFALVEYFAAFTFGGYLVAESRGRRDEPAVDTVAWTAIPLAAFALVLEGFRGYAPGGAASIARPILATVGVTFGAVVYRQQLTAVRHWLAARAGAASGDVAAAADGSPAEPPAASPAASGDRPCAEPQDAVASEA